MEGGSLCLHCLHLADKAQNIKPLRVKDFQRKSFKEWAQGEGSEAKKRTYNSVYAREKDARKKKGRQESGPFVRRFTGIGGRFSQLREK